MSYQMHTYSSVQKVREEAAAKLNSQLVNNDILLLLSGGSALKLLDLIDQSLIGNKTTITVLDERYSTNVDENNFSILSSTPFYESTKERGASFIDTRLKEKETIDELAARFEHVLRNWKTAHPNGLMIATQGIGPDGHTAGILPFPENPSYFAETFETTDRWVFGYDAENKNQFPLRVTTTIPFLKLLDHSIVYVVGDDKKEVIQKAILADAKLNEVPSSVIQQMKDVQLFTDQEI